jgi:hypothetical protein
LKKLLFLFLALSFCNCKAQTPIIDLYGPDTYGDIQNAYYKDINNFQDQFVGTWIYTNGNTTLKVVFVKKLMFYKALSKRKYYQDVLIGEYQYIENGVEKVNSLSNLNSNPLSYYDYNLYSSTQMTDESPYPPCDECPSGTLRLRMKFDEPANDDSLLGADFVIRKVIENGVEKLKVQFVKISAASGASKANFSLPSTFRNFSLPYGNYTLIKEPN